FTGVVTLTNPPASTPAGLTCSLSVTSITLGTSGTSTLSCTATVAHVYTVTVTAASGAITHTFIVNYIVPAIVAANNSLGFSGVVKLSNSTSPAGLTVTCATRAVTIGSGGSALDNCTFSSSTPNTYLVTFTGTNNTRGGAVTTTFVLTVTVQPTGGFTLAASPTSVTVNAGAPGTSVITGTGTGSFTGTIALTTSVRPNTGLSCLALSSITISAPLGSGTSTLSCNGASGNYMVTVTGTSTGFPTQTATVNYVVQAFSLSAPAITTLANVTGTSTVTVAPINGFTGTITFSAGTVPAGCTASFAIAVLSVTCGTGVAPFSVTVTGASSGLSRTTTVSVTVQDFSLSAPAITTVATVAGTSTVTVTPINGFTGTVSFSAGTVPAGCSASFTGAVLSVTCATGVAPFSVTITGTSGALSRTTTVLVTVQDFALMANPGSLRIGWSVTRTSTITVNNINGFSGTVALALTATVPTGCTVTLSGSVVSVNCSPVATFTVTVTGTS